jgi:hypothetical protein
MKIFDTMTDLTSYLAIEYPKSRGKEMVSWVVSDLAMLVGVYEGEDIVHGFIITKDPSRDFKWVVIDNLHADLAVRYYVEYIQEIQDAVNLFEFIALLEEEEEELPSDEVIEEDEIAFYEDLD